MRRLRRPLASVLTGALMGIGLPVTGFAQTVTFAPVACTGSGTQNLPPTYSENGVTLTTQRAFAQWCSDNPNYAGNGLFINYEGDDATLTLSAMGSTFSLSSIDLAHVFSGLYGAETVNFIGHTLGGGTVSELFVLAAQDGPTSFSTFMFGPDFTDLTSVDFGTQTAPYYQFANIQLNGVTATPEPASVALLATGLLGVFGVLRKKRASC